MTTALNATGPMGANTAWTLTANAGATSKWTYVSMAGGTFRYSVYAKAGTVSWLGLGDGSGAAANTAYFNVSAGTVGTVAGRASAGTIEAVGNGWFRCSATFTAALGFLSVSMHQSDNQAYNWTAAGGETLFTSACQAETGTVATSYIPTTRRDGDAGGGSHQLPALRHSGAQQRVHALRALADAIANQQQVCILRDG